MNNFSMFEVKSNKNDLNPISSKKFGVNSGSVGRVCLAALNVTLRSETYQLNFQGCQTITLSKWSLLINVVSFIESGLDLIRIFSKIHRNLASPTGDHHPNKK